MARTRVSAMRPFITFFIAGGPGNKHEEAYSAARNEMLARTHSPISPWTLVRANDKRLARLNIIKELLGRLHHAGKDEQLTRPDPKIEFACDVSNLENGQLAK